MAIPREELQRVVDAGHPDQALIGLPVSLVRELLRSLPVETVADVSWPIIPQGAVA